MSTIDVIPFEVPDWVQEGVESGQLEIVGGVVRNELGQIKLFLEEAELPQSRNGWIVVGAVAAAAAVVGTAYYAYQRRSKRGRARNAVERIEKAIRIYLERARDGCLSLEEVRQLAADLQRFIELVEELGVAKTGVAIDDPEALERLTDFHKSLRAFNLRLSKSRKDAGAVPPSATGSENLLELMERVRAQLAYQSSAWP